MLVPNFPVAALVARIEALRERRERVRWVHLVWDLREMIGQPIWEWEKEELWERLGERFVQYLKGKSRMQEMIVTVGSRILRLERKGAEWVERGLVPY